MVTPATEPGRNVRPNTQFARVNTASFRGERGDATLRTSPDLVIRPGVQLAEGCFIGKQLGKGIQGQPRCPEPVSCQHQHNACSFDVTQTPRCQQPFHHIARLL